MARRTRIVRALARAVAAAVLATGCAGTPARAAENIDVEARIVDEGIAVATSAIVHAPFDVVWRTLTDYDHFAEFIPGMRSSRLIGRSGSSAIVEQSGSAGNRLLSYSIDVVVESREAPPSTISVRILSGNMRTLEGSYRLEPVAGSEDAFLLRWNGIVQPDIDLPGVIEEWALRRNIRDQFRAMLGEIERRGRLEVASETN